MYKIFCKWKTKILTLGHFRSHPFHRYNRLPTGFGFWYNHFIFCSFASIFDDQRHKYYFIVNLGQFSTNFQDEWRMVTTRSERNVSGDLVWPVRSGVRCLSWSSVVHISVFSLIDLHAPKCCRASWTEYPLIIPRDRYEKHRVTFIERKYSFYTPSPCFRVWQRVVIQTSKHPNERLSYLCIIIE